MVRAPRLPYVDPHKPRGRFYLTVAKLSATKFGAWFSVHIAWKLDPLLMKVSGGRLSTTGPLGAALLESKGARSGQTRRNATLYFHDGERVTIIASKRGWPENPAWYHNLRKYPDVLYGGLSFRAELITGEAERRRLWNLADRVFPEYADYHRQAAEAGRVIPIFQLTPPLRAKRPGAAALWLDEKTTLNQSGNMKMKSTTAPRSGSLSPLNRLSA